MRDAGSRIVCPRTVALVGNPNAGKTTVFNALTGLRQKIGNYPGVTVEKKEGRLTLEDGVHATLLDLPGTYSLNANAPDERIATEILLGQSRHTPRPDLVVCIVDASNLERNLYLVSQLLDQEIPLVVALNMLDIAARDGIQVDYRALARELGVPVVPMVANKGEGIRALMRTIETTHSATGKPRQWPLPEPFRREWEELAGMLREHHRLAEPVAFHEALTLIAHDGSPEGIGERFAPEIHAHVIKDQRKLDFLGINRQTVAVESRYLWISSICRRVAPHIPPAGASISDRLDRILTHRIWGPAIFFILMAVVFQAIFTWAEIPMEWIGRVFDSLGAEISRWMPPGALRELIVSGALGGVAAVVTFLPQILFLFLFLGILEDTGYMARAAFIMDRLMSRVGLHGKSFIPLLSSFACAIPGIMATRTIEHPRDRLATLLVAPLMGCSARLPVYALLIAACIPPVAVFGFLSLPALTLFAMYFLGLVGALTMAWVFKKTLLRAPPPAFIMELPPYKIPSVTSILVQMGERALVFLRKAGTIILGASIILWFLASYPRLENATPSERLQYSLAGRAGRAIEPLIRPLGFDWKIGIGLVSSLLQREMFVSTMGTIYNVQGSQDGAATISLKERLQHDTDPVTGKPLFTALTGVCLMVYYVFALQCLSTVAIVKKETNSWRWPLFQIGYMTALAYAITFVVYRTGIMLGLGD
jgi:ferrous iron transport protein B